MSTISRWSRWFVVPGAIAASAGLTVTAWAQPTQPLPVPEYDPNQFNPPAAPAPAPAAPTVIVVGPDGKPVGAPPVAPTGVYHYDDLPTRGAVEEDIVLHAGPTPELHVVRRGDTLWDICWYYFNDPWQWPKVWSYNAQITNPHWIYPGDLVRLLPKGFLAPSALGQPELEPETAPPPTGVTEAPAPARRFEVSVRQVAFVEKAHLDSSLFVVGAVEDKQLLATGDEIYVSYPADQVPRVGARYSVYAEDQKAVHPDSRKVIGSYVHVLGEVEILSVPKGKHARARITSANNEIERGARVGPLIKTFKTVPPARNEVNAQGTIVAMLTRDQLIGTGEVVFMDLGQKHRVKPGNRLFVVRRGDAFNAKAGPTDMIGQDNRSFPARALGEVVIVEVGPSISVGLITLAVEEMGVGDLVMMREQ